MIYSEERGYFRANSGVGEKRMCGTGKTECCGGGCCLNATNIHRRYPEVAIFIPDSMGTGLWRAVRFMSNECTDFQKGHLNFNLDRLNSARRVGSFKMERLMIYEA